jgi:hypothetical protein
MPAGDAVCAEVILWTSDAEGRQWSEQDVSHVPTFRTCHGHGIPKGHGPALE